jgi:hypothetical protein
MQIAFPYHLDGRGMTARAERADHVRQMIEQVLLTSPGERVNRPEFGCGLDRMLFADPREEALAAFQALAQASLQQWLGDVIRVQAVDVSTDESRLQVTVTYVDLTDQKTRRAQIGR